MWSIEQGSPSPQTATVEQDSLDPATMLSGPQKRGAEATAGSWALAALRQQAVNLHMTPLLLGLTAALGLLCVASGCLLLLLRLVCAADRRRGRAGRAILPSTLQAPWARSSAKSRGGRRARKDLVEGSRGRSSPGSRQDLARKDLVHAPNEEKVRMVGGGHAGRRDPHDDAVDDEDAPVRLPVPGHVPPLVPPASDLAAAHPACLLIALERLPHYQGASPACICSPRRPQTLLKLFTGTLERLPQHYQGAFLLGSSGRELGRAEAFGREGCRCCGIVGGGEHRW